MWTERENTGWVASADSCAITCNPHIYLKININQTDPGILNSGLACWWIINTISILYCLVNTLKICSAHSWYYGKTNGHF